jgi:hypothetical protein
MSERIAITSWEKYQHYKKRNPPWIKLHSDILQSRMWVMMKDTERLLAVALMVLAARHHNAIPADTDYIKKVCYLEHCNLKPLLDIGFCTLQADASNLQANANCSALLCSDSGSGSAFISGNTGDWTLEDCIAASEGIAMRREDVESFWNHYAAVDFVDAAGRKITNLKAALGKWKTNQAERKAHTPAASTPARRKPDSAMTAEQQYQGAFNACLFALQRTDDVSRQLSVMRDKWRDGNYGGKDPVQDAYEQFKREGKQ